MHLYKALHIHLNVNVRYIYSFKCKCTIHKFTPIAMNNSETNHYPYHTHRRFHGSELDTHWPGDHVARLVTDNHSMVQNGCVACLEQGETF